jgi:tRNA(Ile)-lysidine synthase
MQGKKLLSKFFKDEKYSTLQKEAQWILCSGDQIVWVVGKRCDNRFAANETTEEILLMKCEL